MKRAAIIVLDSVGIGELPDAAKYGDEGSNTLVNIKRNYPSLDLKNMCALGLGNIEADGAELLGKVDAPQGCLRQNVRGFQRKGHNNRPLGNFRYCNGKSLPYLHRNRLPQRAYG